VVTWSAQDVSQNKNKNDNASPADPNEASKDDDAVCEIHAFGKTATGQSVVVRIKYCPYFYVNMSGVSIHEQELFIVEQQYKVKSGKANQHSRPVNKYDAWGYNQHPEHFVQLAYDSMASMRAAKRRLAAARMHIYEGNVDPIIRLCHIRDIAPTGWIRVDKYTHAVSRMYTRCDLELITSFEHIGPTPTTTIPPLVLCSWDIEVYSHDGSFPSPDVPENSIIQIACAFKRLNEDDVYRHVVVCLGDTADIDTGEIICVHDEADVLTEFIAILNDERVDILTGWNTWQFDWKYVSGRQSMLTDDEGEELVDLTQLGRGGPKAGTVKSWELNSGAYGNNNYLLIMAPGIVDMDMMQVVKRDHKLDSYSLNAVASRFLGETKLDLPAHQIFAKYRQGPSERAEIAQYAVQDVCLPVKLFSKLCLFDNLAQMSVATCVPLEYLLTRGQQIKVFSLILKQARQMNFLLPDDKRITIDGKYEGATVLDAQKGAYFDVISGLDFASLYPTIIRSYNLCYSSLVLPSQTVPDDVEVYTVETGLGTYTFVQHRKGIVPTLLENLATWRSNAKKKMAECKKQGDLFGASVWNGAQLAFKVSANSVYGFLGASKGFLPCVPIAASVTATGRLMIEKTKRMALELVPGSDVVYGDTDSVMVKFNVPPEHQHDMATHFKMAQEVAKTISDSFPGCIELEFEKCYYPYLLYSKKRYAGLMYTRPETPDYIDVKGLQLVRRDNAKIVKQVSQAILDTVMHEKSADGAIHVAQTKILSMLRGEQPIDQFVVSKSLRGTYANPKSQPHVQVAQKIRDRTGEVLEPGSRVPYVFVVDDHIDQNISCRAEDPTYAQEHGLELDFLYYLNNQVMSPVTAMLDVLVDNPAAVILDHPDISRILTEMQATRASLLKTVKRVKTNAKNKQMEITKFFQ